MFGVAEALEKFIASLELTEAQAQEVSRQHTAVRENLRKKLQPPQKTDFLSGSYSRNTAIRPLHDIDIFVVLADSPSTPVEPPDAALLRTRNALRDAYPNKDLPVLQSHSVHIEFSVSGIEFDLVPAYEQPGHGYFIPDRDTKKWIRTNPQVHKDISTKANERAGKKLKPLLKAIKHWNRRHQSSPLGSFHLEVMSYDAFPTPPGSYLEGLERLFAHLADRVMKPCPDPAWLGPNVDARMTDGQRKSAQEILTGAARKVRAAITASATNTADAHARLKELFGDEYRDH